MIGPPDYCRIYSEDTEYVINAEGEETALSIVRSVELHDFSWFVCYLNHLLDALLTRMADARAERTEEENDPPDDFDRYGGCVCLSKTDLLPLSNSALAGSIG